MWGVDKIGSREKRKVRTPDKIGRGEKKYIEHKKKGEKP